MNSKHAILASEIRIYCNAIKIKASLIDEAQGNKLINHLLIMKY